MNIVADIQCRPINLNIIPTLSLRVIERFIRGRNKILNRNGFLGSGGNTDTDRNSSFWKFGLFDVPANSLRDRFRLFNSGFRKKDAKFLASVACCDISSPQILLQNCSDDPKSFVTCAITSAGAPRNRMPFTMKKSDDTACSDSPTMMSRIGVRRRAR